MKLKVRNPFGFIGRFPAAILLFLCLPVGLSAAEPMLPIRGRNEPALAALDDAIVSFLKQNQVPGTAVAITRQGKLVYAKGFGWADVERKRPMEPDSRFRIASVSKSITAAAILKLVESREISLQDRAFPYLGITPFLRPGQSVDPRLDRITIEHLLHHSGGFDRELTFDPALHTLDIARGLKTAPPVNPTQIIQYMMGMPLAFDPGTDSSYSNLGYCVLGRVIEKASGRPYEDFVRTAILEPLGITDMRLGRTFPEARAPGEVTYYSARHPKPGPSAFGDGLRPYPYGVWCLESMDAFAGWIATPIDLVKFANALDHPEGSPILSRESIGQMFARPPVIGYDPDGKPKEIYKGCGWFVRTLPGGRTVTYDRGLLDGTSALVVREGNGIDWAVIFNSDTDRRYSKELAVLLDPLIDHAIGSLREWPSYDLYGNFSGKADANHLSPAGN
jgi:N-acyl-D-amino-acid deacylase